MTTIKLKYTEILRGAVPNYREALPKVKELAADILANGLLVPLMVWKKGDRYALVDGNRRDAAIALIRKEHKSFCDEIECTLFEGDENAALLAQVNVNLSRENPNAWEYADAIKRLVERKIAQKDIATKLGKSEAWVSRMLKIRVKAGPELTAALKAGTISVDAAITIADAKAEDQAKLVAATTAAPKSQKKRAAKGEAAARGKKPGAKFMRRAAEHFEHADAIEGMGSKSRAIAAAVLAWVLGDAGWSTEHMGPRPNLKKPIEAAKAAEKE